MLKVTRSWWCTNLSVEVKRPRRIGRVPAPRRMAVSAWCICIAICGRDASKSSQHSIRGRQSCQSPLWQWDGSLRNEFSQTCGGLENTRTIHTWLVIPYGSLQGLAERSAPCKYNAIQVGEALSRRKRGFKSRRRRHTFNELPMKALGWVYRTSLLQTPKPAAGFHACL